MHALHKLQQRALDVFMGGDDAKLAGEIVGGDVPASVRIAVYRNNLRENYRNCLAKAYPVIVRLVGDDCFRGLAARYARGHVSTNGDLQFYGAGFAPFLDETYRDSEFGYLPDVARLEWAIEQAMISPRSEPIGLDAIAGLDPSSYSALRFSPRPGLGLVESAYPVLSIWRANQETEPGRVDLSSGGERVAVLRAADGAELRLLDEQAFALARAFAAGLSLGEAAEVLAGSDSSQSLPGFDLGASLKSLFVNHCLARSEA